MKKEQDAGNFSAWLNKIEKAQDRDAMDVPCGECNACCRSSYFIHIKPNEKETLKAIPNKLLFPAPGLPKGHKLMGYDQNGKCPMLINDTCSIYEHRPLTCRNYDCRVFAATGIKTDEKEKAAIATQVELWKFSFKDDNDYKNIKAVQAVAQFLKTEKVFFPKNFLPQNDTQLAILAIKVYKIFLIKENRETNADVNKTVNQIINQIKKVTPV
jgi:uncharacterized protein